MARVIVFGSLNMDLSIACERIPQAGETLTGSGFITNAGGKGANQAVAAARLGAATAMIGAVGADAFGDELRRGLDAVGVDTTELATVEEVPTGVAVIIRTEGDNRIVLDPGTNHALRIADVKAALDRIAQAGDIFITQLECDITTTLAALHEAHERGLYTIFNPAPAQKLPQECWNDVDLLCLNETECAAISGMLPVNDDTAAAAFKRLAVLGVRRAIITRGIIALLIRVLNGRTPREILDTELYFIDAADGKIRTIFGSGTKDSEPIAWMAESGILGTDAPDRKYISHLTVRLQLTQGAKVTFAIEYDSSGEFETVGTMTGDRLRSFAVPLRTRRCDHLRLRITGMGDAKVFSIAETIEIGSDLG